MSKKVSLNRLHVARPLSRTKNSPRVPLAKFLQKPLFFLLWQHNALTFGLEKILVDSVMSKKVPLKWLHVFWI